MAVPDDFAVSDGMREQAAGYGLSPSQVDFETDKFLDHFRGNGAKKIDWQATWRNWMRRSTEFSQRGSPGARPRNDPKAQRLVF